MFICIYLFVNYFSKKDVFINLKEHHFINKNDSYDHRNITFKENNIKLEDINKNLFKKQILDILLNNNVNDNTKLNIIDKYKKF